MLKETLFHPECMDAAKKGNGKDYPCLDCLTQAIEMAGMNSVNIATSYIATYDDALAEQAVWHFAYLMGQSIGPSDKDFDILKEKAQSMGLDVK